jgi:hypothetical protein
MSTFKLQNRIEDTGRVITGMVVTDDDHLLLCDFNCVNSKLLAVYVYVYPVDNVIVLRYVPSLSKQ